MENINIEDYYMTPKDTAEYLNVSPRRLSNLVASGLVKRLKGSVYERGSVEAYKLKRGDKKGGRYPAED